MNGLLLSVFMVGMLGGVHCVGMCGGIVSAFSVVPGQRQGTLPAELLRVLAYNAGRIGSYTIAGATAGAMFTGLVQGLGTFAYIGHLQLVAYAMANLMLVALGLFLMDAWHGIAVLERGGRLLWRRVQPMTRRLLPVDSFAKAFALGGLWGWVPCGMVYSVLPAALLSGSAAKGAATMFAFGLGTLPLLLTMGLFGTQLRPWLARRSVRVASGALVLAFGLLGLWRVASPAGPAWFDALCVTPVWHAGAAR